MTHICVSRLTIIGSNNGLSPDQHQAIIWTNAGKSSIGPLGINFSEILNEIHTFSFRKMHLKMSFGKWRPFCLGLNVLRINNHRNKLPMDTWFNNNISIMLQRCCDFVLTSWWCHYCIAYPLRDACVKNNFNLETYLQIRQLKYTSNINNNTPFESVISNIPCKHRRVPAIF